MYRVEHEPKMKAYACSKCGATLRNNQRYCANCGCSVDTKTTISIWMKRIAIIAIIVGACNIIQTYTVKFSGINAAELEYVEISETADGSAMTVIFPKTAEGKIDYTTGYKELAKINNQLDIPLSLIRKMDTMSSTNTAEYNNLRITWEYKQDKGLVVLYEKIYNLK